MRSLRSLFCRRTVALRLSVLILVCLCIYYAVRRDVENIVYQNYCAEPISETPINATELGECKIPKLNPFDPQAMSLVKDLHDPIKCKTQRRAILNGGELRITDSNVAHASYRSILRPESDDFQFIMSGPTQVADVVFPVFDEFIELTMKLTDGTEQKEFLMQAVKRPDIESRAMTTMKVDLNVLIIAIDSISNGHAQRKLPKSFNYIKNVLEGYVFMGHSVVGDGTTEQVAAFLTGRGEQEYTESRRGEPGAKSVDDWNWIFKKAKAKGYVTSYCEDSPQIGTFQYRLVGFQEPPTDYYPRPFFLAASETYSSWNPNCYGSEKIYEYHLDLARKIYEQYPKRNKFLFHFAGEISHEDFNKVQQIDDSLLQFMAEFKNKGYLNNTLLIVLGDHGWRYGEFRQTVQGKLEERLPFFTMTFPKWFKTRYPETAKNLKTNTQRLTSWYDVYATFNHLLDYPNEAKNLKHGQSLLTEVPTHRSCLDASIPEHWCPCVLWSAVDHAHNHMHRAALEAVNHINNLNFQESLGAERCSELKFFKLSRAEVEIPSTKILRFRRSGKDGYEPEYSSSRITAKDRCHYQITFITLPNHGIFEASVHYLYGRFLVKGSVSRINKYGDEPKCIAHVLPHLRKYCHCKL